MCILPFAGTNGVMKQHQFPAGASVIDKRIFCFFGKRPVDINDHRLISGQTRGQLLLRNQFALELFLAFEFCRDHFHGGKFIRDN